MPKRKRIIITIDEAVYDGLVRVIGGYNQPIS